MLYTWWYYLIYGTHIMSNSSIYSIKLIIDIYLIYRILMLFSNYILTFTYYSLIIDCLLVNYILYRYLGFWGFIWKFLWLNILSLFIGLPFVFQFQSIIIEFYILFIICELWTLIFISDISIYLFILNSLDDSVNCLVSILIGYLNGLLNFGISWLNMLFLNIEQLIDYLLINII